MKTSYSQDNRKRVVQKKNKKNPVQIQIYLKNNKQIKLN